MDFQMMVFICIWSVCLVQSRNQPPPASQVPATSAALAADLLVSIVASEDRPSHVVLLSSWGIENKRQLFKKLSASKIFATNFQEITNATDVSDIQHWKDANLFFITDFVFFEHKESFQWVIYDDFVTYIGKWLIIDDTLNIQNELKEYFEDQQMSTVTFKDKKIDLNNANDNFNSSVKERVCEVLEALPIFVDSEIIIATYSEINKHVNLNTAYKRSTHSTVIYETYGYWNSRKGFVDLRTEKVVALRRVDLNQTEIVASVVITNNDTFKHLTDYRNQHIDAMTKLNYALTNELLLYLNAKGRFIFTNTWGYREPSGVWNGMVGDMMYNGAHLGGSALLMVPERVSLIEYIVMTTPSQAMFVFRQPRLSSVDNIFRLPFHGLVWLSVAILVLLSCVTSYVTLFWEKKYSLKRDAPKTRTSDDVSEVIMNALGSVCQQSISISPHFLSGRQVVFVTSLALMFLYTAYAAYVVALLQSSSNTINSLQDLLRSSFKLGVDDLAYNRYYFAKESEPLRRTIYQQKIAPKGREPNYMSAEEGIAKMRQGIFAFHAELAIAWKLVSETFRDEEKCGLTEIKYLLNFQNPWYAVQKHVPYLEMFKIGMHRIMETGVQSRVHRRIYTRKPQCAGGAGAFVSVGWRDVQPALLLWALGLAGAATVLLMELLLHYRNQRALAHNLIRN